VDVFEAIRTTRAMRRLDPSREVSDEDIRTIVEAATKGGSAGNRQPVRWLVVRDAEKRRQLGELYRECVEP
jgi:nitroreductase